MTFPVSFYLVRLRLLKSWIFNRIDDIEQPPLEDIYYNQQVSYEMKMINSSKEKDRLQGLYITDHAYDMAKERLGMNRTSFEKISAKALEFGVKQSDSAGNLKRYIDSKYFAQKSANNIRIYGENLFIFSKQTLITVYQIPNNLRKSALKIQKNNHGK